MSDETPVSVTMQKDGEIAVVIVNNPRSTPCRGMSVRG